MKRKFSFIASGVIALGAGVAGLVVGSGIGGECTKSYLGCRGNFYGFFGPTCLIDETTGKGYCTVNCDSDEVCVNKIGPGWGCRGSSVVDERNRTTGETQKVCYNPQDTAAYDGVEPQPAAGPQPAPAASTP